MPPFMNPQPPVANAGGDPRMNNPLMALLTQGAPSLNQQQPQMPQMPPPGPPVGGPPQAPPQGMPSVGGGQAPSPAALDIPSLIAAQMGGQGQGGPQMQQGPPQNPVVETFDNAPPIIQEAIRRRLFTQGR